ncbi:protein kinase-like domain, concanavalin A-like lectin/glucanase domain protein [Tanacetum coccineum]|uniref:Protein kinase-like domain, concanavalin A-like lectin/glucanase domain protein n=1 Tax=Tanacetum coccineum TaxID=301880 RepID=A0ABQ5A4T1_9ASTR
MAEGEIDNLTMEQYLALNRGNQASGMVKPKIGGNVNFEIKSQFMRELREDTFFESKNDDAHEHVERVLDIVSLFNIPRVSHDAVMLRVFPITLTGAAKQWVDRLPLGTVDSWDLLKKAFIQRYCTPPKTAKQLEEIYNFKQEGDETLYQAWERYNDLLYKFPTHDINIHQKVNIFYNGFGTMNRQLLDSQGPIPDMTPTQALTAIQNMADHSQKWHDGSSNRNIDRAHIDKDCPLNEEVKSVEEVKYGEFGRSFPNNNRNDGRFNRGGYDQPSSGERRPSLTEIINKYMEEASKRHAEQDEWLKKFYQSTETSREAHDKIIQGLETKVKTLANEVEGRVNNGKFKECKTICTEDGLPLYTPFYYSPEEMEYFSANSGFSDNEKQETDNSRMAEALEALEATLKIKKEPKEEKQSVNYYVDPYEPPIPFLRRLEHHAEEALVHKTMESLKKIMINSPLLKEIRDEEDDLEENLEDPEECGEDKANVIMRDIHNKLNDDWFNNTSEDEDDLEGILDYLEPRSYNGFIGLDGEAYIKRMCKLLGMTYEEKTLILIEKVEVTRYVIGPGEIYTKVKVLRVDEIPRTRDNVAAMRARLMEKMGNKGNGQAKT